MPRLLHPWSVPLTAASNKVSADISRNHESAPGPELKSRSRDWGKSRDINVKLIPSLDEDIRLIPSRVHLTHILSQYNYKLPAVEDDDDDDDDKRQYEARIGEAGLAETFHNFSPYLQS